jgi:GT2 family glycosyltransferase
VSRVGVVILTHNRADEVTATLTRMVALPDRPRLVVVDNGSTDHTAERLSRRFPDVELVRLAENLGAAGRNAGVARLDTPYVAFCDDDTWWAAGSLDRAADLLDAHPRLGLVCGRVVVGPTNAPDPACAAMESSPLPRQRDVPGRPVLGFMCAASTVRRHAFVDVGGFEPRLFIGGEEELLTLDLAAAGWALSYVPDIVVHHHPSRHRESARRRRLVARNALWCAWLRRPWRSAVRRSIAVLRERARGRAAPIVVEALGGLPWILRRRRVVPPNVEAALRILERGYAVRRRTSRRPDAGGAGGAWEEAPGSSSRFAR